VIAALCILISASLFFLPLHSTLKTTQERYNEAYGQALADSAARESIEAVFRNDLVSLRAVIQSIADNPLVVRTSVRGIDQQTLVQAGPLLHELPKSAQTFESSITLHDSIAGIVTVTISGPPYNPLWFVLYCVTVFVCLGFLLANLLKAPLAQIMQQYKAQQADSENTADKSAPSTENEAENEAHQPLPKANYAYLSLCLKNVEVLKHQLNGATFRKTFKELEEKVFSIGNLYGLHESRWQDDRFLLCFKSHDEESALFNAACSARLLLDLAGIINRVPLDLSAQISLSEHELTDVDMPFVGLAIAESSPGPELLDSKVEYLHISEHESRKLISKFVEPYADLLKKQMEQFKAV